MTPLEQSFSFDNPLERLLGNYRQCLQWRMERWFGPESKVSLETPTELRVCWGNRLASLTMEPERCCWSLVCANLVYQGSFDRASKRMRQIFSNPGG